MPNATQVSVAFAAAAFVALFSVSLLGALFPLILARRVRSRSFFVLADAFAAGILSSAAFVHLLPSASHALSHALPASAPKYPWAGLLALCGAAAVHLLDIVAALGRPKGGSPGTARKALVLASALTLHALLEGLALGASALKRRTFGAILAAVLLHKAFAALSLGAALAGSGVRSPVCAALALAFASVTPLGAFGGLALVRRVLTAGSARLASAGLTAASAGVFAYVAFAELLQHHPHPGPPPDPASPAARKALYGGCTMSPEPAKGAKDVPLLPVTCRPAEQPAEKPWEPLARCAVFFAAAAAMSVLAIWT